MTFTFVRCLRSSAAVTPVKYERDVIQVTSVLIILKNWENNGTEKICLVTPTPGIEQDLIARFLSSMTMDSTASAMSVCIAGLPFTNIV